MTESPSSLRQARTAISIFLAALVFAAAGVSAVEPARASVQTVENLPVASAAHTTAKSQKSLTKAPTPKVGGSPTLGGRLSGVTGTWAPAKVTLKYQWKRAGTAIKGAVKPNYVVTKADVGLRITLVVTGSKRGYRAVARSSVPVLILKPFAAAPNPSISGTIAVGSVVTARPGTWSPGPTSLTYTWQRNGKQIPGARFASYRLTSQDAGQRLSVTLVGSRSGYRPTQRVSHAIAVGIPLRAFTTSPNPVVSGGFNVGSALSSSVAWTPAGASFAYQWLRNGQPIPGAVNPTYALTDSDRGSYISLTVRGTLAGFVSATRTSALSPAIGGRVAISGDGIRIVGQELAPGRYVTSTSTDGCYWARLSDFTGTFDDIISNDLGSGQRIVDILPTDRAFSTSRCGDWIPLVEAPAPSVISTGVYAVGQQITPGLWRSGDGSDGCYGATYSNFSGDLGGIIANDFVYAQTIVRIPASSVGFESSHCGTWTRIGE